MEKNTTCPQKYCSLESLHYLETAKHRPVVVVDVGVVVSSSVTVSVFKSRYLLTTKHIESEAWTSAAMKHYLSSLSIGNCTMLREHCELLRVHIKLVSHQL